MEIGLYRDDGLAVLNHTPQKIEKIKKQIIDRHNKALYQLAGAGAGFSLDSVASSVTNRGLTHVYCCCCLGSSFVAIMLPMYLIPGDYSVCGIWIYFLWQWK